MNRIEILNQLNDIFSDVLDLDGIKLSEETTSDDIDGWDSLAHVQIIIAIQKKFGIKVNTQDILNWRNVGEMVNTISSQLK